MRIMQFWTQIDFSLSDEVHKQRILVESLHRYLILEILTNGEPKIRLRKSPTRFRLTENLKVSIFTISYLQYN